MVLLENSSPSLFSAVSDKLSHFCCAAIFRTGIFVLIIVVGVSSH